MEKEAYWQAYLRDRLAHDPSDWITHFWIPEVLATQVPVSMLESVQREFIEDSLDIIKTDSGGLLIVQRSRKDMNELDLFVAHKVFERIVFDTFSFEPFR